MIRVADLFCGAGGETTGIMQAIGEIGGHHDVAAVNHWNIAIETHKRNHPDTRSYCIMHRIGWKTPQRVYVKRWLQALDQRLDLVAKHASHQLADEK